MNRAAPLQPYLCVTKPGIVLGNLVSTAAGLLLASQGRLDGPLMAAVLTGVGLVVAAGCVLNNCLDRELDRKMARTCGRVMATGRLSPGAAFCYASLLGVAGTALLIGTSNPLCVAIVLAGLMIYVGVYTLLLKPKSVYSTLVGSLAGAAPPLAGYCAVRNRFDLGAVLLLAIFSVWQVPHFYAIAVARLKDYDAASIPVMPVKQGVTSAKRRIVGYILVFTAAAALPTLAGITGYGYLAATAGAGLLWLAAAWRGYRTCDDRVWARRVFFFSLLSIAVLSVMLALDGALLHPVQDLLLTCRP